MRSNNKFSDNKSGRRTKVSRLAQIEETKSDEKMKVNSQIVPNAARLTIEPPDGQETLRTTRFIDDTLPPINQIYM